MAEKGLHKGWATIEESHKHQYYWDDLRFSIDAVRTVSGKVPTPTAYQNGAVLAFVNTADNAITFNAQMPHGLVMGTDVDFHVHIILPTAGAGGGAENVKFDLTYSWAGIGGTFPAYSTLTATRDVQNDAADEHILMDLGDCAYSNRGAGNAGVSDVLICRLTRDTSVADNYADDVYLLTADFHIRTNAPGSRNEYIK